MRRLVTICAVLALAGGCAPTPLEAPRGFPPAGTAQSVPPRPMSPIPASKDACGAAELQGLVGHPRTEIPVPVEPNRQRVACTTCPVTQDYRPERLNFFFDAQSGRIREIKCG
jgi:hypothetical protein